MFDLFVESPIFLFRQSTFIFDSACDSAFTTISFLAKQSSNVENLSNTVKLFGADSQTIKTQFISELPFRHQKCLTIVATCFVY